MCVVTPAMMMMAAGTAMKFMADRQATNRQERERSRSDERQSDYQRRATNAVSRAVEDYRAPDRESRTAEAEQEAIGSYQADIDRARTQGEGTLGERVQGRVSSDYDVARADSMRRTVEQAARLAQLLGKVRGPMRMREDEAVARGGLTTELGQLGSFAGGQYGADQLRIQEAGRPNPLLHTGGSLLSGAGMGMAMAGTGAPPKASTTDWTTYGPPPGLEPVRGRALR